MSALPAALDAHPLRREAAATLDAPPLGREAAAVLADAPARAQALHLPGERDRARQAADLAGGSLYADLGCFRFEAVLPDVFATIGPRLAARLGV